MAEAAAALEASVLRQQEALSAQIGGMLQAFAADRAKEVTAALQGMRQRMASGSEAVGAEAAAIQGALAQAAATLKVCTLLQVNLWEGVLV